MFHKSINNGNMNVIFGRLPLITSKNSMSFTCSSTMIHTKIARDLKMSTYGQFRNITNNTYKSGCNNNNYGVGRLSL